jgi:Periplasmic copper-binding protein (NosD)
MRGARRLFVLPALVAMLLLGWVGSAQAATWFVGPGDSIQAAVDAANPGDTIFVFGDHSEDVLIQKDGLTLKGVGATMTSGGEGLCGDNAFCVLGDVDFSGETPVVNGYVKDVSIQGFTMTGYDEVGILAFGAQDARFQKNQAIDNGEYGIAAFFSTGTRVQNNITRGSDEAGIYIGDSPNADATVASNVTMDNGLGIFLRDSMHGTIQNNVSMHNCGGALVLADEPGPAGFYRFLGNKIQGNSKACPASEDGDAFSGIGVAILGGQDNILHGNQITDNLPSGDTFASAGLLVATGDGGTPPEGNIATGNVITGNNPDILWDGSGSNTLSPNTCGSSVPPGLC